jgi:hypothetical protein
MCIIYRSLYNITLKNRCHQPRIKDFVGSTAACQVLHPTGSQVGIHHQVRVKEEGTYKITLKTRQGIYDWLVMPFGLCNAPSTFM